MDEMKAFEQQLAAELGQMAGPGRRIEGMAMVRTVSTQSPRSRVQSMFSATKLVVAGAVVALFGGVLLAGVLTTSEDGDQVLPPGASASVGPTDDPDLLAGVELDTEEVSPGIFRVLTDDTHDLRQNVWNLVVTPAGDVWVEQYRIEGYGGPHVDPGQARTSASRIFRLGDPETLMEVYGGLELDEATGTPSIWQGGEGGYHFDGDRWVAGNVAQQEPACDAVEAEGSCWWTRFSVFWGSSPETGMDAAETPLVMRVAPDGSQVVFTGDDLGLPPEADFGEWIAVSDDGTVWTDYYRGTVGDSPWAGLAAYDGVTWTLVDGPAGSEGRPIKSVAPDGTLWVGHIDGSQLTLTSWDGEDWTEHGVVRVWWPDQGEDVSIRFRPDGTVWLDALTFFDGTGLRQLEMPVSPSNQQPVLRRYAFAPNGSIWAIVIDGTTPEELDCPSWGECRGVTDGLYVITPEAMATAD